jgi:hypothetical protein
MISMRKVTVQPLGLRLLAGLLQLAGNVTQMNARQLENQLGLTWQDKLVAATEQRLDVETIKNGLRIYNVSGENMKT